ncbi:hypothetical protein H109_07070 [Trichophyton interdigitale MR816]|uniref:Uncharacterized protein n=1 Tax=Trichophyton interdigitale (strain MR816) TaxID=1215338 RepID=A0A059IZE0_TRIIM|nr:hypothetical protein H109_07070 [Trichophyton interdigitale MR816]
MPAQNNNNNAGSTSAGNNANNTNAGTNAGNNNNDAGSTNAGNNTAGNDNAGNTGNSNGVDNADNTNGWGNARRVILTLSRIDRVIIYDTRTRGITQTPLSARRRLRPRNVSTPLRDNKVVRRRRGGRGGAA